MEECDDLVAYLDAKLQHFLSTECLECGSIIDYKETECPNCGWSWEKESKGVSL